MNATSITKNPSASQADQQRWCKKSDASNSLDRRNSKVSDTPVPSQPKKTAHASTLPASKMEENAPTPSWLPRKADTPSPTPPKMDESRSWKNDQKLGSESSPIKKGFSATDLGVRPKINLSPRLPSDCLPKNSHVSSIEAKSKSSGYDMRSKLHKMTQDSSNSDSETDISAAKPAKRSS